eukprot:sb/3472541/
MEISCHAGVDPLVVMNSSLSTTQPLFGDCGCSIDREWLRNQRRMVVPPDRSLSLSLSMIHWTVGSLRQRNDQGKPRLSGTWKDFTILHAPHTRPHFEYSPPLFLKLRIETEYTALGVKLELPGESEVWSPPVICGACGALHPNSKNSPWSVVRIITPRIIQNTP